MNLFGFLIDQVCIARIGGKSQIHGPVQQLDFRKCQRGFGLIFHFCQLLVGHHFVDHFLHSFLHSRISFFERNPFVQRSLNHQQTGVKRGRYGNRQVVEQRGIAH